MERSNDFSKSSFIFGLFPIINIFLIYISGILELPTIIWCILFLGINISIISPFFAIILGLISLKSEKRMFSILGIILGVISIILIVYILNYMSNSFSML